MMVLGVSTTWQHRYQTSSLDQQCLQQFRCHQQLLSPPSLQHLSQRRVHLQPVSQQRLNPPSLQHLSQQRVHLQPVSQHRLNPPSLQLPHRRQNQQPVNRQVNQRVHRPQGNQQQQDLQRNQGNDCVRTNIIPCRGKVII